MSQFSSSRGRVAGLCVGALLSLAIVTPTFASTVPATVTGGSRTASISDVTLGGATSSHSNQNVAGTLALVVDDSMGTGSGWNITVLSSALAYTAGGNGGSPIPAANMVLGSLAAPVMTAGMAVAGANGPILVGTGGNLGAAIKVNSALAGYGMGTYTQNLPLTLTIPADVRAGTYVATLTVTIVSGP